MSERNVNATTQPVADEPVLVGLDNQLDLLSETLEEGRPLLVVITGTPGVGKSSLLQVFGAHAGAAGWNTVPAALSESLSVTLETTEETFSSQVQSLISVPSGKSFIEKLAGKSPNESSPDTQPLLPVVEKLRARAPLLLLLDSFQPAPEFADWFQNRFMKDVKRSGAPIVVTLAERTDDAIKLSPSADKHITLGILDEDAIRHHFAMIGKGISPEMKEDELNAYVTAAHNKPEMLSSLTRVLRLALQSRV